MARSCCGRGGEGRSTHVTPPPAGPVITMLERRDASGCWTLPPRGLWWREISAPTGAVSTTPTKFPPHPSSAMSHSLRLLVLSGLGFLALAPLRAQPAAPAAATKPAAPANPFLLSPEERQRLQKLTDEDHADRMQQLGITKLR